jgi:hypothetical protein
MKHLDVSAPTAFVTAAWQNQRLDAAVERILPAFVASAASQRSS